ncbi:unknown [Clostridium sp. CAG:273]|jgi:hypothetical protein|nr:unknown [Clostridium sp. CAG:273]
MAKKKHNVGKIAVKFMALILAALMILGVAASLVYYLIVM